MRTLVFVLVSSAAVAGAVDHPMSARKLSIRDDGSQPSLTWVTQLPAVTLPAQSPTVVGATLRITAQSGETAHFDLPAAGWAAIQSRSRFAYVFKNREAPGGLSGVKLATVKDQKTIKVAAKASSLTLDEAGQGTVTIVLIIGDDTYCSECTTPVRDQVGRYSARRCSVPAACPSRCGDGVADQPVEMCDGNDPGVCDDFPIPDIFTIGCEEPGSAHECQCCFAETCFLDIGGGSGCCGTDACQDTTGFGMVRGGVCIPTVCSEDADCEGNDCVDGACCAPVGGVCGAVDCCPGTNTVCSPVPSSLFAHCCYPPGTPCSDGFLCCSESCATGVCD